MKTANGLTWVDGNGAFGIGKGINGSCPARWRPSKKVGRSSGRRGTLQGMRARFDRGELGA
jgi:hypothetical protein